MDSWLGPQQLEIRADCWIAKDFVETGGGDRSSDTSEAQRQDILISCGTAAVQDDYSYWHSQHESDDSGKLFLVDTSRVQRSTRYDDLDSGTDLAGDVHSDTAVTSKQRDSAPLQLFFDDNIELDRAHIVDVRDSKSFDKVPFSVTRNVFIRRVEPYFAIVNENYFIEILHEMVDAQISFRHRHIRTDAK